MNYSEHRQNLDEKVFFDTLQRRKIFETRDRIDMMRHAGRDQISLFEAVVQRRDPKPFLDVLASEPFNVQQVNIKTQAIHPEAFQIAPIHVQLKTKMVLFNIRDKVIDVACANPLSPKTIDYIEQITKCKARVWVADAKEIIATINRQATPGLVQSPPEAPTAHSVAFVPQAVARQTGSFEMPRAAEDRNATIRNLIEEANFSWLTKEQLGVAASFPGRLERVIIDRFGMTNKQDELYGHLAKKLGMEYVVNPHQLSKVDTHLMSRDDILAYQMIPLQVGVTEARYLIHDPMQVQVPFQSHHKVQFVLCTQQTWTQVFLISQNRNSRPSLVDALSIFTGISTREIALRSTEPNFADVMLEAQEITEEAFARALALHKNHPFINVSEQPPSSQALNAISELTITSSEIFPYTYNGKELTILTADPRREDRLDNVRTQYSVSLKVLVTTRTALRELIDRHCKRKSDVEQISREVQERNAQLRNRTFEVDIPQETAVNNFIFRMINDALAQRATDIHLEPQEKEFTVRFRVDGKLLIYGTYEMPIYPSILGRIKIQSGMDISKTGVSQDGRMEVKGDRHQVTLRVASNPGTLGEKVVLRILPRTENVPMLRELGFSAQNLSVLEELIQVPNGLILVCGPTGSGKTTTLASVISMINDPTLNIMTVEDPVEYRYPGVHQTTINAAQGVTFASQLRSFLRQDPDIILVGEIRDTQTAKIAVEAAMTGHKVLSTVHTNDASTAVTRLMELGVEKFNIAAALQGVVAQRLVRKVCPHCRVPATLTPAHHNFGVTTGDLYDANLGTNCPHCNGLGYYGRTAIHEVLAVTGTIKTLINSGSPAEAIQREAVTTNKMVLLRDDGFERVRRGQTTLEEVLKAQ